MCTRHGLPKTNIQGTWKYDDEHSYDVEQEMQAKLTDNVIEHFMHLPPIVVDVLEVWSLSLAEWWPMPVNALIRACTITHHAVRVWLGYTAIASMLQHIGSGHRCILQRLQMHVQIKIARRCLLRRRKPPEAA
jgi:hypothetical protein